VKRDRASDDQLVVAVLVGERRRPKRPRGQQLRVSVGDPARRVAQPLVFEIGAKRQQQIPGGGRSGSAIDGTRSIRLDKGQIRN
jgi:hypothetical protein